MADATLTGLGFFQIRPYPYTQFTYDVVGTQVHAGVIQTSGASGAMNTVYIDWGDGSAISAVVGTTDQAYSKDYGSTGNRTVRIYSYSPTALTKWTMETTGAVISGALVLPPGMTYFSCAGSNTLSGTLSMPSGMTDFYCSGSNTINAYSTSAKANNQDRCYFVPVGAGGLSSAHVDQALIDYAAAGGTWTGTKAITLTGTNAARTSASDAAVATLIGKGVTVTTT